MARIKKHAKPAATAPALRSVFPAIPADGVEFELTLSSTDPMATPQTRRFKLVRIGNCHNLDEVRQKLHAYGKMPKGQWFKWQEIFKQTFPKNDGNGPIFFTDPSQVQLCEHGPFLVLNVYGWLLLFRWTDLDRLEHLRWLVASN